MVKVWSTKMMVGPMMGIGDMGGGTEMAVPPLPMVIRTRVSTDLINVTVGACTVGRMGASLMGSSVKTSDMARGSSSGLTEPRMKETLCKVNAKVMVGIPFQMVGTMSDHGLMVDMKALGNVIGRMDVPTRVNGSQGWHMVKVWKPIQMVGW
jgi:hypothetical protein